MIKELAHSTTIHEQTEPATFVVVLFWLSLGVIFFCIFLQKFSILCTRVVGKVLGLTQIYGEAKAKEMHNDMVKHLVRILPAILP